MTSKWSQANEDWRRVGKKSRSQKFRRLFRVGNIEMSTIDILTFWQKHNIFCHRIIHNLLPINTLWPKLVLLGNSYLKKLLL